MLIPAFQSHLSPAERQQVRTLVFKDALALLSIFAITVLLAVATYFLFQSYSTHRKELAVRWYARGQQALQKDQPLTAIDDLHSALLYAPGQRQIEVALASALASAGKILEATAYFNTLWDAEPGNGEINLQLARLASRSGNEEQAKHYFHAAIYGNWEGDGYLKRRDTRLELVRYLISRGRFDQARSELLVASGNAPASDLQVQSLIAGLLVEDHALPDALAVYQGILSHDPANLGALRDAARTAYNTGRYQLAQHYLLKAVATGDNLEHQADTARLQDPGRLNDSSRLNNPGRPNDPGQLNDKAQLNKLNRILILNPSADLPSRLLADRLLGDREIASRRLSDCQRSLSDADPSNPQSSTRKLAGISSTWAAEPRRIAAATLANDVNLQDQERSLIAATEKVTARICGTPSGDDAILLRLADVPSAPIEDQAHE